MPLLLAGDTPNHVRLRDQFERGSISKIDHTGLGFYVDFNIPEDAPSADPEVAHGGPAADGYIEIEIEEGTEKAEAILWLHEGRLSSLELFAFAPWWPPDAPVRITGAKPWQGAFYNIPNDVRGAA